MGLGIQSIGRWGTAAVAAGHFSTGENCVQRTNNDKMHHWATTTAHCCCLYSVLTSAQAMRTHQITHYFPGFIFFCRLRTLGILFISYIVIYIYLFSLRWLARSAVVFVANSWFARRYWLATTSSASAGTHAIYFVNILSFFLSLLLLFIARRARTCAPTDLYDRVVCVSARRDTTNKCICEARLFPPRILPPLSTDTHHLVIIIIT